MAYAWLCLLLTAPIDGPIDTVVVCPEAFRAELAPWIAHRTAQGHRFAMVSSAGSADAVRGRVRRIAAEHPVRFLVLVGDAAPPEVRDLAGRARTVPTHYAQAVVNVRFGSEPQIATDNWYADLDGDRIPELATGRLTSDSPAELRAMIAKILAYEACDDFGPWRRQVHFVAGLGGFGTVPDAVLEAAARTLITSGIPASYATTMTYGSWQSPYCPDPRQFDRVTCERLNQGGLFWVYLGHGDQRAVDMVRVPGGTYRIFSTTDAERLACRHGAPIACLLACYSGAFDQPRDCLAEVMLKGEGGPVAVLCGSRVTMPYGMAVLGAELMDACFARRPETLGELILEAKRSAARPDDSDRFRAALDAVGKTFAWATGGDAQAERLEHLELFHLLGDPLLRLPHPRTIDVRVTQSGQAAERIQVEGHSPIAGHCTVELVVRRDRLTFRPPARGHFDPTRLDEYSRTYRLANEPRLASLELGRVAGAFRAELDIPPQSRGACHVRVFVEGDRDCAAGAADLRLDGMATSPTHERSAAVREARTRAPADGRRAKPTAE